MGCEGPAVHGSRIVTGLAAVFGGMGLLFAVFGAVYSPAFFAVAALFGAVTYFLWYHASGRLARRLYRGVERRAATGGPDRGGFGAEPREEWTPPRDGSDRAGADRARRRARAGRTRADRSTTGQGIGGRRRRVRPRGESDLSAREAYRILDLDPGADEDAVRQSYRKKVKDVHPDAPDGDEEAFKRVTEAYERLSD